MVETEGRQDGRRAHACRKGRTTASKHRHQFQWGRIEGDLGYVLPRGEDKSGNLGRRNEERIHYHMQVRAGGREGGEKAGMGRDRARTSIAIRKSGIRSRNIEEKVDIKRARI